MKKFVRVVEIILIVFAILCGIALLVGYIWFKDNTIEILASIKDFVNQPLPIVGVSILTLGILVYEILIKTSYGRKTLNKIADESDRQFRRLESKELDIRKIDKKVDDKLANQDKDIETIKAYLIELCGYSRNVKAHDLAEKIIGGADDGEEAKDSQAIEE